MGALPDFCLAISGRNGRKPGTLQQNLGRFFLLRGRNIIQMFNLMDEAPCRPCMSGEPVLSDRIRPIPSIVWKNPV